MENSKYLVLAVVSMAVMLTSQAVNAQKVFQINRFVDSVLTLRYWRADIDTKYISGVYDINSIGHSDKMNIRNHKWFARLYFGIRL